MILLSLTEWLNFIRFSPEPAKDGSIRTETEQKIFKKWIEIKFIKPIYGYWLQAGQWPED